MNGATKRGDFLNCFGGWNLKILSNTSTKGLLVRPPRHSWDPASGRQLKTCHHCKRGLIINLNPPQPPRLLPEGTNPPPGHTFLCVGTNVTGPVAAPQCCHCGGLTMGTHCPQSKGEQAACWAQHLARHHSSIKPNL